MKTRLCSLQTVSRGDWLIKASSLDDQILLILTNECTLDYRVEMFYNEEDAFNYIEGLLKNDTSGQTIKR